MLKSEPAMRFLKLIPREAIVVVALFAVFFLISLLTSPRTKEKEITHYLSTREKSIYGMSRLAEIAEKLNFPVEISTSDFFDGIPDDTGALLIFSPEKQFTDREKKMILNWLNDGGILIYGVDVGWLISGDIMQRFLNTSQIESPFSVDYSLPTTTVAKPDDNKLIDFTPPGIEKSVIKMTLLKPERLSPIFLNINQIESPLIYLDKNLKRLVFEMQDSSSLKEPDSSNNSLFPLPGSDQGTVNKENNAIDDIENWKALAKDGEYPGIVEKQVGRGKIIAIANPLCFANGYIDAGNNAQLAVNILQISPKNKKILIDEYHHNISGPGEFKIYETGWGRSFIAILIIGLLAIYSKAIRFIPPRIFPAPERRSQMEYLRSMAQVLRRARALKIVGRIILRDAQGKRIKNKSYLKKINEMESEIDKDKLSESKLFSMVRNLTEAKDEK